MIAEQIVDKREERSLINWKFHLIVFFIAFAIVVSRRPDALFNPQFWAEDGTVWYAEAYNQGILPSLFLPHTGYLQTISRLSASLAQFFPLAFAPLIFNLVAIAIQILPVNLVISSRFAALIPTLKSRLLLGLVYLALPNSYEINANITNAQWHLALLACMVVLAAPSRLLIWRCFDVGVVLISALSGPFAILLTPIAAIRWWVRRQKWLFSILVILAIGALVQCLALLQQTRTVAQLGASPKLFFKILAGQVFLSSLFGQNGYEWIMPKHSLYLPLTVLICGISLLALLYALFNAPLELRLFIIFAASIFTTALASPVVNMNSPQWQSMWLPGVGGRYWFMPMLAFVTTLIWLLSVKKPYKFRRVAIVALAIMLVGITLDWTYPRFADFKFGEYANKFAAAPQASKVIIPINPPNWKMELLKR